MFYRFQYEVSYSFQDAISATRKNQQRSKLEPTKFVGKMIGEFKTKALDFQEANAILEDELSGTRFGIRALKGKIGEVKTKILGSEVGSPPFSRTLTRRPIEAMRSVHVEAKEVQCGVQARCG